MHDNRKQMTDDNDNLTHILGNDSEGNVLAVSCLYDYRNRMVEYRDNVTGQRHTYAYDALDRRIAKTIDADGASPATTRYFYGGMYSWQVCEERDAAGATEATYVYGRYIDEVLNMNRGGNDYYYHTDDLFNVMAVTDNSGTVVERYEYGDYGQPTFMDAAGTFLTQPDGTPLTSSAIANPYLFTGRRYDPETTWYNYRTRYLDPAAGRFMQRDPLGINGVLNVYEYVSSRP